MFSFHTCPIQLAEADLHLYVQNACARTSTGTVICLNSTFFDNLKFLNYIFSASCKYVILSAFRLNVSRVY